MTHKYENPFSLGELGILETAREEKDINYLIEWSKRAVKKYEEEVNRDRHDATKWRHIISSLSNIIERKDLIVLEFEPENHSSAPTANLEE